MVFSDGMMHFLKIKKQVCWIHQNYFVALNHVFLFPRLQSLKLILIIILKISDFFLVFSLEFIFYLSSVFVKILVEVEIETYCNSHRKNISYFWKLIFKCLMNVHVDCSGHVFWWKGFHNSSVLHVLKFFSSVGPPYCNEMHSFLLEMSLLLCNYVVCILNWQTLQFFFISHFHCSVYYLGSMYNILFQEWNIWAWQNVNHIWFAVKFSFQNSWTIPKV